MATYNGARMGWLTYNAKYLYPRAEWGYNGYIARLSRYAVYQSYKDNSIYSSLETFSERLKIDERLYRYVRGVYNPVKRENDLYASNVYQGTLDTEDLGAGALPLAFDNPAMEVPLQQVLKWSNLGQQLSRYVSDAALLGDNAWWVVDDPVRQRVRLELLHPSKIRDVELDEVGNVRACVIEYEKEENPEVERYKPARLGVRYDPRVKTFVYTMKVTKRDEFTVHFETFKDGEPYAYYANGDGVLVPEWDAEYGFVNLKLAAFEPTEDGWGSNSFYAARRKIDELNDQASLLNDTVRRVIEPLLKGKNIAADKNGDPAKFTIQKDERSGISMVLIRGDSEADIEPLTIAVDIGGASANVKAILEEIERDMPVLALQRIREQGNLTAPGVRSGYSDAIGRIDNSRKNLDPPLTQALQMAVTIGAVRGYAGFEGFDASSYDRGDMELRVKDRAVIPDELTTQERLAAYGTVKDLPTGLMRRALMDMGIPSGEIDEIIADATEQQERQAREAAAQLARQVFPDDEGEEEDEDAEERERETA